MAAYKHGVYTQEQATSLVPMTEVESGLIVAFGTAPVHLASSPIEANTPMLCYSYAEAVAAFGYSDDWEKYTLSEVIKTQFAYFNMAPVVLVNVLDKGRHIERQASTEVDLLERKAVISKPVLLPTLKVALTSGGAALVQDADYTAAYNDEEQLVIHALDGGAIPASAAKLYVEYTMLKPESVTAEDIIGGIDTATMAAEGLELVEEVFPRFGLIPGTIIAPGWSEKPEVAAVMAAKVDGIDGHFHAIAIADIPTGEVKSYTAASEWKNRNNYTDRNLVACWPMVRLGNEKFHLSTQIASMINRTDADHGDVPYYSPSNKRLQANGGCLADGTEVFLSNLQANYLNGQGIVTALNFIGGWKSWGNRTGAYPSNTDVKDNFIVQRRMFHWVGNTLITSFWAKIDEPANKRLIETIIDSANIWLNGLTAKGALLGGRVEFLESENPKTDLMDGKLRFHVYMTPPAPAREIVFIQEYDPRYIDTLFD